MLNLIDKRMFTFEIIFKVGRVGILNTEDDIHHRIFDFFMADKGVDGHSGFFFENAMHILPGNLQIFRDIIN
nr:hypothetical protein [Klebsiella variicola]